MATRLHDHGCPDKVSMRREKGSGGRGDYIEDAKIAKNAG